MGHFEISKNHVCFITASKNDELNTQCCERVGSIYAASWVICILGKVPLMLNDKTGLGAASLASEMTSFSGGQDNAKPHSAHTTARLCGKSVWLLNWSVCRLESSLSRSTFTLIRDDKIKKAKLTRRLQVCSLSAPLTCISFSEQSFFKMYALVCVHGSQHFSMC